MARDYDLSDPTDLDLLKADFDAYSADEWQEMIDYSLLPEQKKKFSYDERGCLMTARKKALYNAYPSYKQMVWALKLAEKIEEMQQKKD
jgi:exodeoxyribonuclease V alpha subunit